MKKIIIFALCVIYFVFQSIPCYSQTTETKNIVVVDSGQTVKLNIELTTSNKEDLYHKNDIYIRGLNVLVTVVVFILGFFIAINIISGKRNLKKAKELLKECKDELEIIRTSKETLKNEIVSRIAALNMANEANKIYIQTIKEKLTKLLDEENPNPEIVFYNLTEIIEDKDIDTLEIVSKCMKRFKDDPEIIEKCQFIVDNIAKKHAVIA